MAHMIDESNARANIAYVGETPWHGLGQALQPGQPIETWAEAAGLAHTVLEAPVLYNDAGCSGEIDKLKTFDGQRVLFRSDTRKPLSIVSKGYQIVQPATVLQFFEALCRHNGFAMETAGSLDGGKRIWALARVSEGAPVIGHDVVRPYVLLATSYDGTMATVAKLTTVRVVCHNTLTMSNARDERTESEKAGRSQASVVRVSHSAAFDPEEARLDLGIAFSAFDRFIIETRLLAKQRVDDRFCTEFLRSLLPPAVKTETAKDGTKVVKPGNIEDSRAFQQIMGLFRGEGMGSGLAGSSGTAWGLLNAITQHVDHQRGRTPNSRLSSAWFGQGEALKNKARDLLLEVVA